MKLEVGKEYELQGFFESKARVISRVNRPEESYWVEITSKDKNSCYMYYPDGRMAGTCGGAYTLKEIPLKREIWFNVWKCEETNGLTLLTLGSLNESKEACIKAERLWAKDKAVGRVKVVLEEGKFDD